jgi:hypothetical protein
MFSTSKRSGSSFGLGGGMVGRARLGGGVPGEGFFMMGEVRAKEKGVQAKGCGGWWAAAMG